MMSGYACMISIASHGLACKTKLLQYRHSNLNISIRPINDLQISYAVV